MKTTLALITAAAVLGASAASAETATFPFSGFTKIAVSAGVTAEIAAGGAYGVRAEGSAQALERLDIRLSGDTLVIGRKPRMGWNWNDRREGRLVVSISTPTLAALDVSSGASATAAGVAAAEFNAQSSSGASMRISGSCDALNADASSGASLTAGEFRCKRVNADASSGASITAFASESLAADASSGGSIRVGGGPGKVTQETSSGGSVSVGG